MGCSDCGLTLLYLEWAAFLTFVCRDRKVHNILTLLQRVIAIIPGRPSTNTAQ